MWSSQQREWFVQWLRKAWRGVAVRQPSCPGTDHQEQLTRYLLGNLDENEASRLEKTWFSDPDLLLELRSVCDDLIDRYLRQEMPVSERVQFEKRLQSVPYLRNRLSADKIFNDFIDSNVSAAGAPFSSPQKFSLASFLTRPGSPLQVALGSFVLLMFSLILWLVSRPDQRISVDSQPEPLPSVAVKRPDPVVPSATAEGKKPSTEALPSRVATPKPVAGTGVHPAFVSFLLTMDKTRSADNIPLLTIPQTAREVRLQVELPDDRIRSYRAVLQTGSGDVVRSWNQVLAQSWKQTPVVFLRIPSNELIQTEYVLKLLSIKLPEDYQPEYRFQISKP